MFDFTLPIRKPPTFGVSPAEVAELAERLRGPVSELPEPRNPAPDSLSERPASPMPRVP